MSDYKIKLGKLGEKMAADFLRGKGAQIIEQNFYTRFGEIDLIARLGDEFLFCEVKTRSSDQCGYPEQAVNFYKVRHLLKAVNIYLEQKRIKLFWRLDIVSVELDQLSRRAKIRWFKNAGANY